MDMRSRARDWLRQAEDELLWAGDLLATRRWAAVCFLAQQVAEKSLKAIALARGALQMKSHSTLELAEALGVDGEIDEMARILDQYYISTRYPDAFSTGSPSQYFVERQALEALGFAKAFVDRAREELGPDA